ncbi:hypothetical protein TNCV_4346191 [Trichonephila clavipes]|nr:hypothetical protein TNCV_4346191 [Trichonephila clavipes]
MNRKDSNIRRKSNRQKYLRRHKTTEFQERITGILSTRVPLKIAGSFMRYRPETDGRALQRLDSTPASRKLSTIRGVRKKPLPSQEHGVERGIRWKTTKITVVRPPP